MEQFEFLRENVVDMSFLMTYCLMGMSKLDVGGRERYIKLGKLFFTALENNDFSDSTLKEIKELKADTLDLVMSDHHECDDDEKLRLEHRLLWWNYDNVQNKEDILEWEKSPQRKIIEEEMDLARGGRKLKSFDEI